MSSKLQLSTILKCFSISIGSGQFEVCIGMSTIVQGFIVPGDKVEMSDIPAFDIENSISLNRESFYKEMSFRGYQYRGPFKTVHEIRDDGLQGTIEWKNNWTTFIDSLLQFFVLQKDARTVMFPKFIRKMVIDPKLQQKLISQSSNGLLKVKSCPYLDIIKAECLEIHGFEGTFVNKSYKQNFRNLQLKENSAAIPQIRHCYADYLVKGDLSSVSWIKGPLAGNKLNKNVVRVNFASINQRDVALATGKLDVDTQSNRYQKQASLGVEFSGVTDDGKRVMGIGMSGMALSTHYAADNALLWDVPDNWTLEEAATVPLAYFTIYRAFFFLSKISQAKTILIHTGAGGLSQAAIQVALSYGLKVFTTVGSQEKKDFLLKKFPQLEPACIGSSRDTTFGKTIRDGTNGKGVDFVLNTLSDDKLQLSVRCLTKNGTFLETGRHDIANRAKFNMGHFGKRISVKTVFFDELSLDSSETKVRLTEKSKVC